MNYLTPPTVPRLFVKDVPEVYMKDILPSIRGVASMELPNALSALVSRKQKRFSERLKTASVKNVRITDRQTC